MNSLAIPRRAPRRAALALIALALALALPACSAVFRSSIQGTVIDKETWERDRRSAGVVNASVYLYTDRAAWEEDLAAFVEGSEATLPDAKGKAAYRFFQSTKTDANGAYDFTGFIWESLFPKYGKTADRSEVFLLVYHPDYGLWPNPKPLYVVSDVTNQLGDLAIEDLWNEGRLAGTVLDWKGVIGVGNKGAVGLGGVNVNFYVAKSWSYDGINFSNIEFPLVPTATTTTSANMSTEGTWSANIRFPMKPTRASHKGSAPVRVTFSRENYRANDPFDSTDLDSLNSAVVPEELVIDLKELQTDEDIDKNGKKAIDGDYNEAFALVKLAKFDEKVDPKVPLLNEVVLQRWRFNASISGRVVIKDSPDGIEGATILFKVGNGETYRVYSSAANTETGVLAGTYNVESVQWALGEIDAAGDKKNGNVTVTIAVEKNGVPYLTVDPASIVLRHDERRLNLVISVTEP